MVGLLNYMGKEVGPKAPIDRLRMATVGLILGVASVGIADSVQAPRAELDGFMSQSVEIQSPQELRRTSKAKDFEGNRIPWKKEVIKIQ